MTNGPIKRSPNAEMLNQVYKMAKEISANKKKKKKKHKGSTTRDYRGVDGVVDDAN